MQQQNVLHTLKRYQTLYTHRIKALPIAILMPHSACNCRCVMCDIWKGNKNARQLSEEDITGLLVSLKELDTKRVVMSGGEALLNGNFFRFCELIRQQDIKITLLSTGLTLARHADKLVKLVDEVIVSLDGDELLHDQIRNIKGAFAALREGVQVLKQAAPGYPVSARCVIHKLNYKSWDKIILSAKEIGLDRISFLPADVTSEAFNREQLWDKDRQATVLIEREDLSELKGIISGLIAAFKNEFREGFIAESPEKIGRIHQYYAAHHGLEAFPSKKCNAPWVSAVVEADGTVRPCFFHDPIGSVRNAPLTEILNTSENILYRKQLNVQRNETCVKCVCYLNLSPRNTFY